MFLVLAYKTIGSLNNFYLAIDDSKSLNHFIVLLEDRCIPYLVIPFIDKEDRDNFMKDQFKLMIED